MTAIRYFVNDVDRSIDFYSTYLGFALTKRVVVGPGGKKAVVKDPDGNQVELLERSQ